MDWLDDHVAVGSMKDGDRVHRLKRQNIDFIIDARTLYHSNGWPAKHTPNIVKVLKAGDMLVAISQLRARVLIHCRYGRDRTPFLGMVYISKRYRMSYEDAYKLVKKKRPETNIHWEWVEMLRAHEDDEFKVNSSQSTAPFP